MNSPLQPLTRPFRMAVVALALVAGAASALLSADADAESNRVTFPTTLDQLVHYTTVRRGDITEHMLTSQAAIDAVKAGRPMPDGTHVVLVDYRDGAVFRYFVMEKGAGWGQDFDASRRTGDWQFQAFRPDRSINLDETTRRCQQCHQAREPQQHLFTFQELRDYKRP